VRSAKYLDRCVPGCSRYPWRPLSVFVECHVRSASVSCQSHIMALCENSSDLVRSTPICSIEKDQRRSLAHPSLYVIVRRPMACYPSSHYGYAVQVRDAVRYSKVLLLRPCVLYGAPHTGPNIRVCYQQTHYPKSHLGFLSAGRGDEPLNRDQKRRLRAGRLAAGLDVKQITPDAHP